MSVLVSVIRKRKKERHRQRQSMAGGAMSSEELMDSHMFRKFSSCVDYVFDTAEDVNFHSLEISMCTCDVFCFVRYCSIMLYNKCGVSSQIMVTALSSLLQVVQNLAFIGTGFFNICKFACFLATAL